jgi:hypothetical protein
VNCHDVFTGNQNRRVTAPSLPNRSRTSILQLYHFLSRVSYPHQTTTLQKTPQLPATDVDRIISSGPSAKDQHQPQRQRQPPHEHERGPCDLVALSCKLDKARATLVSPAHYLSIPTHAVSFCTRPLLYRPFNLCNRNSRLQVDMGQYTFTW